MLADCEAYRAGNNIVLLEPDLVATFPDSASANRALRSVMKLTRQEPLVEIGLEGTADDPRSEEVQLKTTRPRGSRLSAGR